MGRSKETSVSRAISLTYKILDDESLSVLSRTIKKTSCHHKPEIKKNIFERKIKK